MPERTLLVGVVFSLLPLWAVLGGTSGGVGLASRPARASELRQAPVTVRPRRSQAFALNDGSSAVIYIGLIGLRGGAKADLHVFTVEPAQHKGEFVLGLPLVTSREPIRVPATVPIYIGLKYVQDPPPLVEKPITVVCGASVTLTARNRYNVLCDVDAHLMIVRLG